MKADVFLLGSTRVNKAAQNTQKVDLPYANDFLRLICVVFLCRNDQHPIQQIHRDPVRALVFGPSYPRDAAVRSHDHKRSQVAFECAIQEGKAFYVEHVDLVYEQDLTGRELRVISDFQATYSRDDLRFALFSPLCYLCIDLISELGLDFTGVT